MNRIRKAYLALVGRLEPEVREVVREIGIEETTLYRIYCNSYAVSLVFADGRDGLLGKHYLTCEAAFAAAEGAPYFHVESVAAYKVGDRYLKADSELKLGPKRAKGKR